MSKLTGFAPVFEKDGNRFIFLFEGTIGVDEEEAYKIGVGIAFVEGILTGSDPTWESVNVDGLLNVEANLGSYPVAIIGGPLFDQVLNKKES